MPSLENPGLTVLKVGKARAIAAIEGLSGTAEQYLRDCRAGDRALRIYFKGPVPASGTFDSDLDVANASLAFAETMRADSAAARLITDGIIRTAPFYLRLLLSTTAPSAALTAEGHARPLSRIVFNGETLMPRTSSSLIALTREMIRQIGNAGETLVNQELKSALGEQLDADFFGALVEGTAAPVVTSSGPSAVNALHDLRSALMMVNSLGNSRLAWVMGSDVAKMAAALGSADGVPVFPTLGPAGGELLNVPAIVSGGIGADELYLISGACVLGNIGVIDFAPGPSATLEMSDTPTHDSSTPTGTSLVSMFQVNSVAMRALCVFGALAFKPGAVCRIENINWGGA
jgi:hypothetical protein